MTWHLDPTTFAAVIADAVRAPSIHNSQPWRFRRTTEAIELLLDHTRLAPATDPTGRAARMSCGAALYNLRLALAVRGTPATVTLNYQPGPDGLLARLIPAAPRPATPLERRLHAAIPRRHSNRQPFADTPVPVAVRADLITAARQEHAWLDLILGPAAIDAVAELTRTADAILNAAPQYQRELRSWTRDAGGRPADGVPATAAGPPPAPDELIQRRDFGGTRPHHRDYEREPLIAALGPFGDRPGDDVQAGVALQRVLLTATDLGLACSMFSQPIDVPAIREDLRLALGRHHGPHMVLRIGYAVAVGPTPRRPVDDVIEAADTDLTPSVGP